MDKGRNWGCEGLVTYAHVAVDIINTREHLGEVIIIEKAIFYFTQSMMILWNNGGWVFRWRGSGIVNISRLYFAFSKLPTIKYNPRIIHPKAPQDNRDTKDKLKLRYGSLVHL